jgi:hypothetical protein
MATKQSSWQKTNLSQPKVKNVVITTLVAMKPCRCDKKAWYKGQKLVVTFVPISGCYRQIFTANIQLKRKE